MELNSNEVQFLKEELNIILEEHLSGKSPRSQYNVTMLRNILAKIKDNG